MAKLRRVACALSTVVCVAAFGFAPGVAQADFGVTGFDTNFHAEQDAGYLDYLQPGNPPMSVDARAGAHPDFTVDLNFKTKANPSYDPANPNGQPLETIPDGQVRDIEVDLPAGFYGNPQNRATCSQEEFVRDTEATSGDKLVSFCDKEAQVGLAVLQISDREDQASLYRRPAPIYNMETGDDETAVLGFGAAGIPVKMTISPRTDGDYGLTAKVTSVTQNSLIYGARITLWGNPTSSNHDRTRPGPNGDLNYTFDDEGNLSYTGFPSTSPPLPFLSAPSRCDGPLTTTVRTRSWQQPDRTVTATATMPAPTECDHLKFGASVEAKPTSSAAGQPTGYGIDLNVPQTNTLDERATPTVEDVSVKLPEGTAISPGAADGLQACSDEQLATDSRAPEACPEASKVGTATVSTPLLGEKLEGAVYLGTQKSQDPASGEMYRLFIAAYTKGVRIKLKGNVVADPKTGQLTTTFQQNPQLPFDNLNLQLKDGPRAILTNPPTCGAKATASTVTSYAGHTATSESGFNVDQGCPTGRFSPAFNAGTQDPFAGGLSPFVMTATRTDADQDLSSLRLDLPSGLLGALGKVPVCGEAQAAAGTCGAETRLGSTTVAVGTGPRPFALGGTVSLAGPYKGQPYSLAIAVPAKAGPLDLGMVVVRSPLVIDANKARVSAPVDDLPQIVGGVPLHYRSISVALDRPGFMFNATNCSPQAVVGTLTSARGVVQRPGVRYQAQGCDKLKLAPSLKISYSGKKDLGRGKNPKLTADLGQTFGQAGLKRVRVTLPLASTLKPENSEELCTPDQAAARACPPASIVGRASATTPALREPLTGPVYFLQGTRKTASGKITKTTPKLWLKLRGDGVDLDLRADSSTDNKTGRLVATFNDIPDAPIANFRLELDGGKKGVLGAPPNRDPCTSSRRADVQFDGQNGARQVRSLNIAAPDCGVRASMNATASQVRFGFTGIAAGKLSVSGKGLVSTSRTVKRGDTATVVASLDAATRRRIASGRTVRLRLTATFDPKAKGQTTKVTKAVTIKGAKRR